MKSQMVRSKIEKAEGVRAGLAEKAGMLAARVQFLENERQALAWPVSCGEKASIERLAVVDAELERLHELQAENSREAAQLAGELERLAGELAAAVLEEVTHARDEKALALTANQEKALRLAAEVERLKSEGVALLHEVQGLNAQVRAAGGVALECELPWGSDEKKLRAAAERLDALDARLKA